MIQIKERAVGNLLFAGQEKEKLVMLLEVTIDTIEYVDVSSGQVSRADALSIDSFNYASISQRLHNAMCDFYMNDYDKNNNACKLTEIEQRRNDLLKEGEVLRQKESKLIEAIRLLNEKDIEEEQGKEGERV